MTYESQRRAIYMFVDTMITLLDLPWSITYFDDHYSMADLYIGYYEKL